MKHLTAAVATGGIGPFSILERIDVGETLPTWPWPLVWITFSILERIDVGETLLIISSSTASRPSFSILERIDVGETMNEELRELVAHSPFSILERIDVGETNELTCSSTACASFSILERIDVGETCPGGRHPVLPITLSVSSNGSTWVKHLDAYGVPYAQLAFSILERIDVGET